MERRPYNGVSPYKLIRDDEIYYLVASKQKHGLYTYDPIENAESFVYLEVHKLENLKFDDRAVFIPIDETTANNMSLSDYLGNGCNEYNHKAIPLRFKETLHLGASTLGLDALYDYFGNRMKVITRNDFTAKNRLLGKTKYRYEITINNVGRNEFYEVIKLLIQYSPIDLGLLAPSNKLLETIRQRFDQHILYSTGEKLTILDQ